jgi:hypothetical protein
MSKSEHSLSPDTYPCAGADQVTQKHATEVGNTWAMYASPVPDRTKAHTGPSKRIMRAYGADDRHTDASGQPDMGVPDNRPFEHGLMYY